MKEEKKVTVNGLMLSMIERTSNSTLTPIIYVHGWLDNAASFNSLAPLLSSQSSFAIDLPGHGHSDHIPDYGYYHFIESVSQLIETINRLNLRKCILIGHSLGGCLASIVAGCIPQTIEKLVLLDAIGPLTTPAEESAKKYQLYLKQLTVLKRKKVREYDTLSDACDHRAANGYITSSLVKSIVKRGLIYKNNKYQWRHDKRLLLPSPLRMTEAQSLNFLNEITAPTLLITASKGFKLNSKNYLPRIEAVKNLTLKELNAGHHLHIEKPIECAQLINQFLDPLVSSFHT